MAEPTFLWLRVAAFAIILLPVAVANLRRGTIPNAHNAFVFVSGVSLLAAERLLTATSTGLPWFFWIAAFLLAILLALLNQLPGGAAKFLVALLPWFSAWPAYAAAVSAGLLLSAALGYARRANAPVVPGFYVAGLGALAVAAL